MNKTDERRLVEASAWRTYLAEKNLDSDPGFDAWLAQDIKNQHAWDHAQSSWDFFGEQATAPELLDLRRKALARARSAGRQRWRSGGVRASWAVAASVVIAIAAVVTWNETRPDVYRTDAGERRQVNLPDGSRIQLDASTELRVKYSDHARELTLKHGQARFDVARDIERPFSVLAGARKVVALGTAFNVDMLGKDLQVTLIEGRVAILPNDLSSSTELVPGQRFTIRTLSAREEREGTRASGKGEVIIDTPSIEKITAWQGGKLIFDDEPLSAVIERINRYADTPLAVSEDAASLKLSGVFDTGDIKGFVTTVTRYLPIEADHGADAIRLSHR